MGGDVTDGPRRTGLRQAPDQTRTLIIDVAEKLLRERPFRELSVDEIMRPTGYRRTVFYRHFRGISDVLIAVIGRIGPELAEIPREAVETAGDDVPWELTLDRYRRLCEAWQRHGPLLRALADARATDPVLEEVWNDGRRYFSDLLAEVLRGRVEARHLPPFDTVEVARLLSTMNEAYLLDTFGRDGPHVDPDRAAATLAFVWRRVVYQ